MNIERITNSSSKDLNLDERIQIEILDTISRQGIGSFAISVINALLVYLILGSLTNQLFIVSWLAFIVFVIIIRFAMVLTYWRTSYSNEFGDKWIFWYSILVYCTGAAWGILPLLDAFYSSPTAQVFIVFVVAGMSAAGMIGFYCTLRIAIPYLILCSTPLIIALAMGTETSHYAMAALAFFYSFSLIRTTFDLNKQTTKTIRLESENQNLFEILLKANRAGRDPNEEN